MDHWKRAGYVGMILVLALFVVSASAQNDKNGKDSKAAAGDKAKEEKKEGGKGDAAKGQAVFEATCMLCHEANSEEMKVGPGMKGLFKKPPHEVNGKQHTHDVETIRGQIKDGGGAMPPMGAAMSEKELDDLIAYLQTL